MAFSTSTGELEMPRITEVAVPQASKVRQAVKAVHFCDAYQAPLTRSLSAEDAYKAVFAHTPGWAQALLKIRGWAVYAYGLKHPNKDQERATAEGFKRSRLQVGERVGFTIQSIEPHELIAGEDDKHLDFRVSVYKSESGQDATVTVATVVQINNMFGRIYIALIKPFHRLIVRSMLQNAVDAGRL
jgi:hypothetical protein